MKPYLIQRAKFTNNPLYKGINSILDFDYMGSAKFEFGALPESLERIKKQISDYRTFSAVGTSLSHPSKTNPLNDFKITIFCNKNNYKNVCQSVEGLADNKFYLKEYCNFSDWIHNEKNYRNSDFWWNIKNDFMFWKINPVLKDLKGKRT